MRAPIHSRKHYVQFPITAITTGIRGNVLLAQGVNPTVADAASEVGEGGVIKAVYVELWLNNDGVDGESIVVLCKDTRDSTGPTFAQLAALDSYNNKKNILFTHQGLTSNESIGNPVNVMRAWYKIPKSKQRFGLGDTLNIVIANVSSGNLFRCGFATYKEYT